MTCEWKCAWIKLKTYNYITSPNGFGNPKTDKTTALRYGINWDGDHISYSQMSMVLSEAVANYAHLYAYGTVKCSFLSDLIERPFLNLEDFNCPWPRDLKLEFSCGFPCHKFSSLALRIVFTNGWFITSSRKTRTRTDAAVAGAACFDDGQEAPSAFEAWRWR
jgi:hypothetical protein